MAAILALSFSAATRLASSPTPQPEATPKAVAVLELFTSEGCSSCPSADALLGKLAEAPSGEVQPIILSYHVDYWNRLGWRDRFSDAAYSTRQYAYAHTLHGDGAYTPQLVVNGHTEFVGSNAGKLQSALKEAAKNSPQVLALSTVRNANTLTVSWVGGPTAGTTAHLLLTERQAETAVGNGENSGRKLHHVDVVRAISTGKGVQALHITMPKALGNGQWDATVLLQNGDAGTVVAAGRVGV